jgi:hypothetical protein
MNYGHENGSLAIDDRLVPYQGRRLSRQNAGLQQVGQMTSLSLVGQAANAVELRGRSPVMEGGSALAERDWLVTIARPDGDLNYMVFVSRRLISPY